MYSLMGADLHGINGLNPLITWKLWRTLYESKISFTVINQLLESQSLITNCRKASWYSTESGSFNIRRNNPIIALCISASEQE
jgi:hypothetical protein